MEGTFCFFVKFDGGYEQAIRILLLHLSCLDKAVRTKPSSMCEYCVVPSSIQTSSSLCQHKQSAIHSTVRAFAAKTRNWHVVPALQHECECASVSITQHTQPDAFKCNDIQTKQAHKNSKCRCFTMSRTF